MSTPKQRTLVAEIASIRLRLLDLSCNLQAVQTEIAVLSTHLEKLQRDLTYRFILNDEG